MRPYLFSLMLLVVNFTFAQVAKFTGMGSCTFDTVSSRISILPGTINRVNTTGPIEIFLSQPGYFQIGNENRYLAADDTIYLALDSCQVSIQPTQRNGVAHSLFDYIETQCAALFNTLNDCNEQDSYKNVYETTVLPSFRAIDSKINTNKELKAADQLAISRYFAVRKMTIVSAGIHSPDAGLKQYAMQLVLEQTPLIDICAVGSGKFALLVLCRPLATDWSVFFNWYKRLSKIDKLFVSILLVNAAEFSKSIALSEEAISFLKKYILEYSGGLNNTEADVLIAMKQKLSLSGKGIKSMLGETTLTNMAGSRISAEALEPTGSDSAILYYWATWCGPCKEYMKAYLADPTAQPSHVFISLDADKDKWKQVSKELGVPDAINLQMNPAFIESFRKRFNIESLPAKFLLTKNGFQL